MTKVGQPPRYESEVEKDGRQREQHVIKKGNKTINRPGLLERSWSTGSTRGAFAPHLKLKEEPPVAQVTLSRKKNKTSQGVVAPSTDNHVKTMTDEELAWIYHRKNESVKNSQDERNTHQSSSPLDLSFANTSSSISIHNSNINKQKNTYEVPRRDCWNSETMNPDYGISYSTLEADRQYSPRKNPNHFQPHKSSSSKLFGSGLIAGETSLNGEDISYGRVDYYASMTLENNQDSLMSNCSFGTSSTRRTILDRGLKSCWNSFIQHFFYNSEDPEFTTLQQNVWATVIGAIMGLMTALWGWGIEFCVEFVWKTVPEVLLRWGIFTDLEGARPLPHYMWVCPAVFGGVLSYISAMVAIPGQNEWINSLHSVGIMDHSYLIHTVLISTAGMASGLSLGPELPLVLIAGMVGSYFGKCCNQTMLSARVINLTAASAAIGGFFGFPMAGALFVLELPHRMGLQYFEAFSPATLASIIAVLVNRMVTHDEVNGYFEYPRMNATLPSHVFYIAIVYGVVGLSVGSAYAEGCLFLKKWVHDWFHTHDKQEHNHEESFNGNQDEKLPLMPDEKDSFYGKTEHKGENFVGIGFLKNLIAHEPLRSTVAGVLAGFLVGIICMFIPHSLFWGEAQLQTIIDRGKTTLPIFGSDEDPTAILTAYGYCIVDTEGDDAFVGFGTACAGIISAAKILVIGLSLGTGIVGGHFWGPLYVGCAASHFFVDLWSSFSGLIGFGSVISDYPCVAMICIMGSAHIVTYRAHMAIMLILTLSIKSFSKVDDDEVGDYSAIFPLLVVACFISLQVTKGKPIFYISQRCRGDIDAIPEALCVPYHEGSVLEDYDDEDDSGLDYNDELDGSGLDLKSTTSSTSVEFDELVALSSQDVSIMKNESTRSSPIGVSVDNINKEQERLYQYNHSEPDFQTQEPTQRVVAYGGASIASSHSGTQDRMRGRSLRRRQSLTKSSQPMQRKNSARSVSDVSVRSTRSFGKIDNYAVSLLEQGRQGGTMRSMSPSVRRSASPSVRSRSRRRDDDTSIASSLKAT